MRRYLFFALSVFVTVLVLSLLNWIPSAVRKDEVRRYKSIEDVKSALKIRKIFLPAYFPHYLIWPPTEIYAAGEPYKMVLMHFSNSEKTDIVLSIRQAEPSASAPLQSRIEPVTVKKRNQVILKGRKGLLSIALCRGGESCNSVAWQEDGYNIEIVSKDTVGEVLKIAESMMSD